MTEAKDEDLELFSRMRERRCPEGHFIGDGARVVRKMLARGAVVKILCTPEWAKENSIPPEVQVHFAPREKLSEIVGYRVHHGVMALGRIPTVGPPRGSLLLALDGLDNSENVGAILRTCAAFGVEGVLVGPSTASPWLRRAVRVSLAAALQVPVHPVENLAEAVRPLRAYAAHIHGERKDYTSIDYRDPCCLVLGGEANGVSDEVLKACRGIISIPMAEGWDCLNVASSAAVLLAEVCRQRAAGPTS